MLHGCCAILWKRRLNNLSSSLKAVSALDYLLGEDPMTMLVASRAVAFLPKLTDRDILNAEEGDSEFVPFVNEAVGRRFLLGDVLTEGARRNGTPSPVSTCVEGVISIERALAILKKRCGSDPTWFNEKLYLSSKKLRPEKQKTEPTEKETAKPKSKAKKGRGRPKAIQAGMRRVGVATITTHISRFSTLGDFIARGFPNDKWIFAVPPEHVGGRPYDFLESLHNGDDESPWVVMTYRQYLKAMLAAARRDEAIDLALAEREALDEATRSR